jgi:zinc resistance-associated protein
MKKTYVNLFTTLLLVCAVIGFGTSALADPGPKSGPHWRAMDAEYCYGSGHGYGKGRGFQPGDFTGKLSEEDQKKLDQERQAFRDATKGLKQDMRKTRFELMAELSGKEIDAQKAMALQKKLSDLSAQLDQKRLGHLLKIKEMFPDFDDRHGAFFHKGRGPGRRAGYSGCR